MRIVVDDRWIGSHGIGRFAREMISRLDSVESIRHVSKPSAPWDTLLLPFLIQRSHGDLFFSPGYNAPRWSKLPFVFTIHDLIHLEVPTESNPIRVAYYESVVSHGVRSAAAIVTVSQFSKSRILRRYSVPDRKIFVVGNGVSHEFKPNGAVYRPGYSYLLYVGNQKPHKNIERLVEVFARLRNHHDIHIVTTGRNAKHVRMDLEQRSLAQYWHEVGQVSDDELGSLYRGATAVVFPSLYEGFGLPPLEAMACGTPVVVSNVTAIPEVCEDGAMMFNPYSVDSIFEAIESVMADDSQRKRLIEKGLTRAGEFTWDKSFHLLCEVFARV